MLKPGHLITLSPVDLSKLPIHRSKLQIVFVQILFAQLAGWADCCWQLEPELPSPLLELPPTEAEAKRAQMGRGEEKGREDGAPVRHMREAMTNTETNTNTRQSKDKYKRSQIRRRAGEDATPVRRHMRPRERRALAGPANSLP